MNKGIEMIELWNNPLISIEDRLEIAIGAIKFRDSQLAATEQSSKEIERLNALVAMQAEALKHAQKQPHPFGHLELFEKALSASSETVEAFMAEHDAKVLEEAAKWFEQNYSKVCSKDAALDCNAHVHLRRMAAEQRAIKQVKE